jgi:hypothetical protein
VEAESGGGGRAEQSDAGERSEDGGSETATPA